MPETHRAVARDRRIRQREHQRRWLAARRAAWFAANGPCRGCGSWERLEVDHIDPAQKVHHNVWSWSEERRAAELAKCQVLCEDCHKVKTITEEHAKWEGNPQECQFGWPSTGHYRRGCRCAGCCRAKSEYAAAYRARARGA